MAKHQRKELYRALSELHIKLNEIVDKKDSHYYRQFHTMHKADRNCPYLGPISDLLQEEFIIKEVEDLIKAYNEYKRPG